MTLLTLDKDTKQRVKRVVEYARQHIYYPGMDPVPEENDAFVAEVAVYRMVFTFTHAGDNAVWRHLTVSAPEGYPHPTVVNAIAHLCGFAGYDPSRPDQCGPKWTVVTDPENHCVAVVEPAPDVRPTDAAASSTLH